MSTNRVVLGQIDNEFHIRVSKEGIDVLTATDYNDFLLDDRFGYLGIHQTGTALLQDPEAPVDFFINQPPTTRVIYFPPLGYTPTALVKFKLNQYPSEPWRTAEHRMVYDTTNTGNRFIWIHTGNLTDGSLTLRYQERGYSSPEDIMDLTCEYVIFKKRWG